MARGVRLNPRHDERTRAKIQTSQIINRLEQHVKGDVQMTGTQVRAAEILLKKTLPDLTSVELFGKVTHECKDVALDEVARMLIFAMRDSRERGVTFDGIIEGKVVEVQHN